MGRGDLGAFSATGGDTTRTYNGKTIHTYTTTGAATLVTSGNPKQVEYLIVGGGGHGVAGSGGGGGAGGYRTGTTTLEAGTYNIQVGAGSPMGTPIHICLLIHHLLM